MITFITSVKHPVNCFDYENVWDLLRNTLFSVCSQTRKEFRVIVVCNEVLDKFDGIYRITKNTDFVTVKFPPPSKKKTAHTGVRACNRDRGLKYLVGLLHAKQYDPEYVMFFDYDDFISETTASKALANPGKSGWFFARGLFLRNWEISYHKDFSSICGTSHILNYKQLTAELDFKRLSSSSSLKTIDEYSNKFYIRGILGCHRSFDSYFFNLFRSLEVWGNPGAAIYNLGTGENHSGKHHDLPKVGWFPLRKSNGRLERCVYELNLPLVDHKFQRIGICSADDRCRQALKEAGLYNPAELTAAEYISVFGENLWRNYETIAYTTNPWERMVHLYHLQSRNVSFKQFLSDTNVPQQWAALRANNTEPVNKLIQVHIRNKNYSGVYSDYYDEACLKIVSDKFPDDIRELDYVYKPLESSACMPYVSSKSTRIPNIIHFNFGLADSSEEFQYFHYLAILTASYYNNPDKILFHYHHEPTGKWWDRIKYKLTLNKVDIPQEVFGNELLHYAHKSDIVRMQQLLVCGGIYLDLDVICLRSFAGLLDNEFVLGIQNSPHDGWGKEFYGACNAVMLSVPNSKFLKAWYAEYVDFNSKGRDSQWDYHSVKIPYLLAQNTDTFADDLLLMGPESFFFPSWLRMNELFLTPGSSDTHSAKFAKSYCVHLWETDDLVTTGLITPESIAEGSSTISLYAGPCLVATTNQSASLVFLTHNRLCDLQDCLPTYVLLAQARDDIVEILIYDNNSDAETKEYLAYLEQLPLVRVIYGGENIGVAGGRAVLFKEAMGDIIFSLDSDSKSGGEGIIDEAKEILSDPGVGMCGTAGCAIHDMSSFEHTDYLEDGDVVGEVDSLAGCCQIFRRDVLDSMHMDLAYAPFWLEDTDLCLQLRAAGLSVQRFASKGRFIHEWGATGDKLFPDSFHKKFEYFKSKWCS